MCDTKAPVAPTNGARHRHSGHTYLSIRLRKTGQHGMTAQYSASFSRHARIIDRSSTLPLNGPGTQEGRRSMNLYSLLAMSILLYLYISFLLEAFFPSFFIFIVRLNHFKSLFSTLLTLFDSSMLYKLRDFKSSVWSNRLNSRSWYNMKESSTTWKTFFSSSPLDVISW